MDLVEYSANYQIGNGSAQPLPPEAAAGMMAFAGVFLFVALIVALAFYVYFAICLMKIAKKTNTPNGWFAWIPILNVILMLQIAKKPLWWIILMIIPIVNIVIGVMVWMEIAKALGKPEWLGIVFVLSPLVSIIPVIGAIISLVATVGILGYLAFSNNAPAAVNPEKA